MQSIYRVDDSGGGRLGLGGGKSQGHPPPLNESLHAHNMQIILTPTSDEGFSSLCTSLAFKSPISPGVDKQDDDINKYKYSHIQYQFPIL